MRIRRRGFTLVEVLVALLVMAILATMAWQGLGSVIRSRDATREALDQTQRLSTVITQWEQDLQAVYDTQAVPPLSFDGRALRLTRRAEGGVVLVTWSVNSGTWQRWLSPTVTRVADLQDAWMASQSLMGNEPGNLQVLKAVSDWQVYFHRGGTWTNPQSSGDLAVGPGASSGAAAAPPEAPASGASPGANAASGATGAAPGSPNAGNAPPPAPAAAVASVREVLPAAVRLVIKISDQTLTRDVMLGPAGGGA